MVDKGNDPSWKQQKRELKREQKREKRARRLARKEEKAEQKLARRQLRKAVAYRSQLDRSQAVALIEELLEGVKSGQVSIEHGDQQLSIAPAEVVDIRVRGRQSHKTEALTIRLRWPRTASAGPLKVTSS